MVRVEFTYRQIKYKGQIITLCVVCISFSKLCNHVFLSGSQIYVKLALDGRHEYGLNLRMGSEETSPWISCGVALHASCWDIDDFNSGEAFTVDHAHS